MHIWELENLQNLFIRMIFQVPISTPKCSFNWETKTLVMKMRIWKSKLNFYKYLQNLSDETLAKEIGPGMLGDGKGAGHLGGSC